MACGRSSRRKRFDTAARERPTASAVEAPQGGVGVAPVEEHRRPPGFASEEAYRRALAEAARAPKEQSPQQGPRAAPQRLPAQTLSSAAARREAERKALELIREEAARLVTLKAEKQRRAVQQRRAAELQIAARAPKVYAEERRARGPSDLVEDGRATRPVGNKARRGFDRSSRATLGTGGTVPPKRRDDRRVAECPAAGRRVPLPGTYVVKAGDTLWKIADRFYDDGEMYMRIVRANKGKIPDPNRIEPCQRLILPDRRGRWRT